MTTRSILSLSLSLFPLTFKPSPAAAIAAIAAIPSTIAAMTSPTPHPTEPHFPYVWRVRTRLPERHGQPCRVLHRGTMNSCLLQFEDGHKTVTSRNYIRRAVPLPVPAISQLELSF